MSKFIGERALLKMLTIIEDEINILKNKIVSSQISDSASITTKGEFALDAIENNASISGTLANKITSKMDTNRLIFKKGDVYNSGWSFFYGFSLIGKVGLYLVIPMSKMLTMKPSNVEFSNLCIYGDKSSYIMETSSSKPTSIEFSYKHNFLYVILWFNTLPDIFINGNHDNPLTGQAIFTMTV